MTDGPSRQPLLSVQALRAIAVLLVACFHTGSVIFPETKYFGARPFGHLTDMGHVGVDLFFVISGFVITLAHYRDVGVPARAGSYLRKRLIRIYPTYWVAFAIMLVASMKMHATGVDLSLGNIADNILLVPATWQHEILGVSWTLRFEMLFYALFLLCILNGRLFVPIMVALATLPIVGYCLAGFSNHSVVLLNAQLAQFVMGVCTARLFVRQTPRFPMALVCLGILLFVAAYARGVLLGDAAGWDLTSILVLGVASSCLIYGLSCLERNGRITAPAWLAWFGGASYSIYLVHFPALSFLAKLWIRSGLRDTLPDALTAVLFMCLAVGAGCVFHVVVERPFIGLLRPSRRSKSAVTDMEQVGRKSAAHSAIT